MRRLLPLCLLACLVGCGPHPSAPAAPGADPVSSGGEPPSPEQRVRSFILKHDVPYNPLHDQGYPSIGCWPCTQAVADGADERSGRWAGTRKKECGLHVIEVQGGSGI